MRTWALVISLFCPVSILPGADPVPEFNRDVRPILSDKCYHCHGPDAAAKRIPLRLDSESAAKADLGGRSAIVEGDPSASGMIKRITAEKPALRMPPVYSGLKLSAREIETLQRWVASGAKWQKHWSFIPPSRPALPGVRSQEWVRTPIDGFIVERLEREGMAPSPEARRETLLRRVTLDLTGVPPTPAEIADFLADKSPNAYEKVVDRLLASPRYGERMAARWLDAARYADSNGYQFDGERFMWRWRDWVIEAFNRNQPFDQFTLEQIAGDMLPNPTRPQIIATGFNRNHRGNTEAGIVPEEYAVEYVVDRVETTSAVFLGLTLGCARCHNHKYDPFTQKEFYQLFAYMNNIPENGRAMKYGNSPPMIPAPTRDQEKALAEVDGRIRTVEEFLSKQEAAISREQAKWEKQAAGASPAHWAPSLDLAAVFSFEGQPGGKEKDGTLNFVEGKVGKAASFDGCSYVEPEYKGIFDIEDQFSMAVWVRSDQIPDGSVVSKMRDSFKGKGYGIHVDKGKVHVNLTNDYDDDSIRVETEEVLAPNRWYHLAMTYNGARMAEGLKVYIDGKLARVKVLADTLYRPFGNAGKPFGEPFRIGTGWGRDRRFRGSIDDVRTYSRILEAQEIAALAAGQPISAIAAKPAANRTPVEQKLLRWYFLENAAPSEIRNARTRLLALRQEREKLERSFPTVMVMSERPQRRDTHLLIRGAYDAPGEKVEPGVPEVLPPLPEGAPNNRLGFAKWLIHPDNPLMARVTVNRFWQMYFGTGLVKTTEDFGKQGDWPSHPELLDWLATEFIRTGWDVKGLQKLIVMSATYRQQSKATPELLRKDPENRLLARGPRLRLPAEMIRDQALFAAGLLKEKLGGPSVKPYQPEGLWKEVVMQDMYYIRSTGDDLYRRSLYTFWKRTVAPPMMMNFDAAGREICVVRETRTNTPLQALNLMNDVTFVEAARFIGQRMMKEGGPAPAGRLRYGFLLTTGRAPSAAEEEILMSSLNYHLDYFSGDDAKAKSFLSQGESQAAPDLDRRQLAAYAAVGSLLLNLDETVTKE